jgi:hypothetical protein
MDGYWFLVVTLLQSLQVHHSHLYYSYSKDERHFLCTHTQYQRLRGCASYVHACDSWPSDAQEALMTSHWTQY